MWGNLFGNVLAPPPPAEDDKPEPTNKPGKIFSLGEELPQDLRNNWGAPAGAGGIRSDLPPGVKSAQAAEKVRAITTKRIEAAWQSLQQEFDVQKMVWQSCQATAGQIKSAAAQNKEKATQTEQISSLFDKALKLKPTDPEAALKVVEEAREAGLKFDVLNKSIEQASDTVLKETRTSLVNARRQLAQRLDLAGNPATLPKTEAAKVQIRNLVEQCELDDTKMEKSIKKILDLLPPEEMTPVNGAKRSSGYGSAANGKKGSKMIEKGTPASKKTSSRVRSLGAPAAGSKMSSLLRQLPPPSDTLRQVATYDPVTADMPPDMRSERASERVRLLASQKIDGSWNQLKSEFGVQKMVWESRALIKQVDATEVSTLTTTIQKALTDRTTDPSGALRILHPVLEASDKNDLISNSMAKSMRNVMKQANLITDRSRLAERLATASVPATLPRGEADKRELEKLVVACELDDIKFEVAVRKILLLPPPQIDGGVSMAAPKYSSAGSPVKGAKYSSPVGSPASAKKSSGFAGTAASKKTMSAPRSASTGGIKSKAAKPMVERIREDHMLTEFAPPARAAGRIEL
mmetsp:Transcript_97679/g.173071  ORF Transcript_97679/g.173071 Transcript_97679/m.173071 type:complete len:577 (-) Transcript_97679:106-1836(-)